MSDINTGHIYFFVTYLTADFHWWSVDTINTLPELNLNQPHLKHNIIIKISLQSVFDTKGGFRKSNIAEILG